MLTCPRSVLQPSDRNGLPEPLLESISLGPNDPQSKMNPGILHRRVFSFFVTDGAAELQVHPLAVCFSL